jgi:hypothetical protein
MKTLAELQTEIELGLRVYPSTNHDVWVFFAEDWYIFSRTYKTPDEEGRKSAPGTHPDTVLIGGVYDADGFFRGGGVLFHESDCYESFEALLADWPSISAQPVWSTAKTPERLQYDEKDREETNRRLKEIEERQTREMLERRRLGLDPF